MGGRGKGACKKKCAERHIEIGFHNYVECTRRSRPTEYGPSSRLDAMI